MQWDCRPLLRIPTPAALVHPCTSEQSLLTATDGRSRTSSTAVPGAVLPRQPLPALLYLLHPCSRPPSMESCASRHLHVHTRWPECKGKANSIRNHAQRRKRSENLPAVLKAPSKTPKERVAHRADRPESGDNSALIAQNVLYTIRHQFCRFCCSGAISAGHQAIRLLTTSIVLKELKTTFVT